MKNFGISVSVYSGRFPQRFSGEGGDLSCV